MPVNTGAVYTTRDFRRYTLVSEWDENGKFMTRDFRRYSVKRVWL